VLNTIPRPIPIRTSINTHSQIGICSRKSPRRPVPIVMKNQPIIAKALNVLRLEIKNPVIAANGLVVRVKGNRYFPEVSGELSRRGTDQSGSRPAARDHPIVTKEY
jgi:hypothetical protein